MCWATLAFLSVGWDATAIAEEYVYRSELTAIYYNHPEQLRLFTSKVRPNAFLRTLNKLFLGENSAPTDAGIGEFIDGLFRHVQMILEMHIPNLHVNIRLYESQQEFSAQYRSICSHIECSSARTKNLAKASIAFYWKKTNTIYILIEKLSTEVLAHEVAHVIIENYFIITPPQKISELFCRFVEKQISVDFR